MTLRCRNVPFPRARATQPLHGSPPAAIFFSPARFIAPATVAKRKLTSCILDIGHVRGCARTYNYFNAPTLVSSRRSNPRSVDVHRWHVRFSQLDLARRPSLRQTHSKHRYDIIDTADGLHRARTVSTRIDGARRVTSSIRLLSRRAR